jgi:hypothetical protein
MTGSWLMIERREPKWDDVAKHCEEEIERLHRLLETPTSPSTTNQLRGEIRAFRRVLKLGGSRRPCRSAQDDPARDPHY